jgi:ribonuclease D
LIEDNLLIETPEALAALVERLRTSDAIGVDTEFHSEKRFRAELFLIQISDRAGCVAVDPVAVRDISPLRQIFAAEAPVKVFHSARNDIEILSHVLQTPFSSVFDTQLAGAFLGEGEQTSLASLISSTCGASPRKGHTLSDWSLRPLSSDQIEYAMNDVRYLLDIYDSQNRKLISSGRLHWYQAEARSLTDPSTYGISPDRLFRRARSAGKVRKSGLPYLWAMVLWREKVAKDLDRPRNFIMKDFILAAIAAMQPTKLESLARLRGISSGFLERWGGEILEVIENTRKNPPSDIPEIPSEHAPSGISARKKVLQIFLTQESERLGIAASMLLPGELLERLAADPPSSQIELHAFEGIAGWRTEALGADLVALLRGELALCLKPGKHAGLRFVRIR